MMVGLFVGGMATDADLGGTPRVPRSSMRKWHLEVLVFHPGVTSPGRHIFGGTKSAIHVNISTNSFEK